MQDTAKAGKLGENLIERLATEAGLICEFPNPDVSGIDRTIKWPVDYDGDEPHDKIPASKIFHLQIKTTTASATHVKLKLSAAHHLIQTDQPCAICVPIYKNSEPDRIVLFHIDNDVMDRILKRLRQCSEKSKKPRKSTISFNLSKGTALDMSAVKFRKYFEEIIDNDVSKYSEQKALYRKNAGYDDARHHFKVTISAKNEKDFVDGFLGNSSLNVTQLKAYEKRFDISLPSNFMGDTTDLSTIKLLLQAQENWTLTLRKVQGKSYSLSGDVVSTLGLPFDKNDHRTKWKSDAITITFYNNGEIRFDIDIEPLFATPQLPTFLKNSLGFIDVFLEGDGELTVSTTKGTQSINLDVKPTPNNLNMKMYRRVIDVTESIELICEEAGITPFKVNYDNICEDSMLIASALITGTKKVNAGRIEVSFTDQKHTQQITDITKAGLVTIISIEDHLIALATVFDARPQVKGTSVLIHTSNHKPGLVKKVTRDSLKEDIDKFAKRAKDILGCDFWVIPPLDKPKPTEKPSSPKA